MVTGWEDNTQQWAPFPSPSAHEQAKCVYVIAHHCMRAIHGWMQHQRHTQQRLSTAICCSLSQRAITTEQQETCILTFTHKAWCERVDGLARTLGGCVLLC